MKNRKSLLFIAKFVYTYHDSEQIFKGPSDIQNHQSGDLLCTYTMKWGVTKL